MSMLDPDARLARELSAREAATRLSLYAALGDSFSVGTGCERAEAWPEQLAEALRAHHPSLEFRNLAVEGATSAEVAAQQLSQAIELEPDLVTVVCGANDVLRSTRPDVQAYVRSLAAILRRLTHAVPGVRILTATAPERWDFLELGPRTRARVESGISRINRATRGIASAYAIPCLDAADHPGLADPANFSSDGLHPSAVGHRHAVAGFAALLRERCAIETTLDPPG